ncbi:MAG: hypothetical protein EOO42_00565 [Flavobacteriales bacterium]|nr:MAG: hypothetical protein EOO42_00565 [Flavobacteriales bacterium]
MFSCKKGHPGYENPSKALKLPLGNTMGDKTTKAIGVEGGSLTSKDGTIKIEIPAGALDATIMFSIQEVENVLKNRAKSFRLLPENIIFKKPISLTYSYGNLSIDGLNPDFLFLAYQDKDGHFYSANKTKGRQQTQTLFVQTTRFGDWTFYSRYDLYFPNKKLVNGELRLVQDEEAVIQLKSTLLDNYDAEYGQIQLSEPQSQPILQKAVWDYSPKKGLVDNNPAKALITYKAPATIDAQQRVYIEVAIIGDLEADNLGNKLQQIYLTQAIVLNREGYFILSENGVEIAATEFSGQYLPALGPELTANFANGYNLSCIIYGNTGSFSYNQHGADKSAVITLSKYHQGGMFVFRPADCEKREGQFFSQGTFNMKTVAMKKGEYFEGDFSVTLYDFDFCKNGVTKNLTGKFKRLK